MELLNSIFQRAKRLNKSPRQIRRRCGACLFELAEGARSAAFDVDLELKHVFLESDEHRSTLSRLRLSADRGCTYCFAILGFLDRAGIDCTSIEWLENRNWDMANAKVLCRLREDTERILGLEICVAPTYLAYLNNSNIAQGSVLHPSVCGGTKVIGGTGNPGALRRAAIWLDECQKMHPGCPKKDAGFVPTRILDIGDLDETKITFRERLQGPIVYAALSHHWSKETEAIRLLTRNIDQRRQDGIALSDLPRMMQDAIFVLRELDIWYVWIDSLCILQDSTEDWLKEAAMMAQVYSNAELTIAATWCHGSGQSLFSPRSGPNFVQVDLPREQEQTPPFIRRSIPHFVGQDGNSAFEAEENGIATSGDDHWPLVRRGWVYQEQRLSRRMLHFTEHEMVWICKRGTRCECGYLQPPERQQGSYTTICPKEERSIEWTSIVEQYSGRDFTKITDRLPALAGIATALSTSKRPEHFSPNNYSCGLWSSELPESLFWRVSSPKVSPRPPMEMPTWSWASTVGSVSFCMGEYSNEEEEIQPKVLDIQVAYRGHPFMGDVKHAKLRVEGFLIPATAYHGESCRGLLETTAKTLATTNPEGRYLLEIDGSYSTFAPDYALETFDKHHVPEVASVVCFLFGQGIIGSADPEHGVEYNEFNYASGLVLRKVGREEDGEVYERIGYLTSSGFADGFELAMLMKLAKRKQFTVV